METIDIWGPIKPQDQIANYGDFSSLMMKEYLSMAGGEDVHVRMQTVGGSVLEGFAIYNLLKNYEGKVTTENMGISGSIGSMIFLAGEKRIANKNSSFFIHEAQGGRADDLEKYNIQLANLYSEITGKEVDFFLEEMKKETTYNGQETYDMGFATEMGESLSAVAYMDFLIKPQTKEPLMAEKAEAQVEAQEAQDKEIEAKLAEKDAEMVKLKEEIEALKASQEEAIKAGIEAEKQRESEILNSCLHEKQAEFAKELVAKGESVVNAKLALMDNFKANQGEYMKVDPVAVLEAEAPQASKGEAQTETRESIYAEIKQLKAQGDFAGADKLYNKLSEVK